MQQILFLIFLVSASFLSHAQKKDDTDHILKAGDYFADFEARSTFSGKLPFKDIRVYDYRFDSSKIGYLDAGNSNSAYSRIQNKRDWSSILNRYFAGNLDLASGYSLVMVIRSFWLQQGVLDEITDKKVITKSTIGKSDFGGICYAKIDIYIAADSLTPYFILDETFSTLTKFKTKNLDEYFFLPFDSLAKRLASADLRSLLGKRSKKSFSTIEQSYKKRFDIPVLTGPTLSRGIFRSFEDFKNNKPMIADFKLVDGKLTDELYIISGKEESLMTDYWGVFDGKSLWIKTGFNLYKAVRQQSSFEVYGGKHISNYHNNPQQGDLIRFNSMSVDKKILHLDMDTGKFY